MKKTIFSIIILSLLSSCYNHSERFIIDDFSTLKQLESAFTLPEGKYVDKVKIHVRGTVSDTTKLGKYLLEPGDVNKTFTHDWYSSDYSLTFDPYKATQGEIEIEIEFVVL